MIMQDSGHIVTVASLAGITGCDRLVDYCASKFAAVGFDESLRTELAVSLVFSLSSCPLHFFLPHYYIRFFFKLLFYIWEILYLKGGWTEWNQNDGIYCISCGISKMYSC